MPGLWDGAVHRLICIDLQLDPTSGLDPNARAIFGARQLLAIGRRLGWAIAHTRRRADDVLPLEPDEARPGGIIRPLLSEPVYLRAGRDVTDSPGFCALLETWRDETVYVAAFDHIALISCLIACYDCGPHLVLVEDALSETSPFAGRQTVDSFRPVAAHLASGATSIGRILASDRRLPAAHA